MDTIEICCKKCGESRADLLDVAKSPSGQVIHILCQVCAGVTFIAVGARH